MNDICRLARVCFTDETSDAIASDPLDVYEQNYPGMTRGELIKFDRKLYMKLWTSGMLESVPTQIDIIFGKDPLTFYERHYMGMTQEELAEKHPVFYGFLERQDLLYHIPSGGKNGNGRRFTDPIAFYRERYNGLTRGELRQIDVSLYQVLWRKGLLKILFTKKGDLRSTRDIN